MSDKPVALQMADELDSLCDPYDSAIATELRRLHAENEKLKTVMVAAAEEISAHWDAHCDDEGYGPANLMHRLERGIPSQYGYTAGEFERLRALNAELVEALRKCDEAMAWDLGGEPMDTLMVNARNAARAALTKVETNK